MSDPQAAWSLASESVNLMAPFYQEETTRLIQEAGAPTGWFQLNNVRAVEPEPFGADQAQLFAPYNHPAQSVERYEQLAEAGLLTKMADGRYCLSKDGRAFIEGFFAGAHQGLADLKPLPEAETAELRSLLERVVQASLDAPEPAAKPVLNASRWTDPGASGSEAARVDQFATDLYRFRDDAHVAAWRAYDVDGATWEALTLVWQEQAVTGDELFEARPYRGFTGADYAAMLESLVERGWLESEGAGYRLTADGRRVREAAEAETDRLFYGPWSTLSEGELDRLEALLTRANDKLQAAGLAKLWSLMGETSQAIFAATRHVVAPLLDERFRIPGIFSFAKMLIGRAPERLFAADYGRRNPFVNPVQVEERLAQAAENGLLSGDPGQGYMITEQGQSTIASVEQLFYEYLSDHEALPAGELDELADLLQRLVQNSLDAPEPADKWAIETSHKGHPGHVYGPLARIDQHLDDLNAFRDDAHNNAWRSLGVSGRTWETLTLVWRDQVKSATELAERLAHRSYTADDYGQSLDELVERAWLQMADDSFRLTPAGLAVRQKAETTTDRLFFAPWQGLEEDELAQLRQLLIRLKLALQKQAEAQQSPSDG